jgi:hypothetical protein
MNPILRNVKKRVNEQESPNIFLFPQINYPEENENSITNVGENQIEEISQNQEVKKENS